ASHGSAGMWHGNGEREKEKEEMRVVSLLYHDVVPCGDFESSGFPGGDAAIYKLELPEFEQHLNAIHAVISRPATVRELSHLQTRATLLTFDDGGSSAHTCIADLLERLGWRGHFFVTTNWIGQRGVLTPAQIRGPSIPGHLIRSP